MRFPQESHLFFSYTSLNADATFSAVNPKCFKRAGKGPLKPKLLMFRSLPFLPTYLWRCAASLISTATMFFTSLGMTELRYSSLCRSKSVVLGMLTMRTSKPSSRSKLWASKARASSEPLAIKMPSSLSFRLRECKHRISPLNNQFLQAT